MHCYGPVGTTELALYREVNVLCPLFRVSFKRGPLHNSYTVQSTKFIIVIAWGCNAWEHQRVLTKGLRVYKILRLNSINGSVSTVHTHARNGSVSTVHTHASRIATQWWHSLRRQTYIFTEPEHVGFLILYEHAIVWIEYFSQQQQEELL